MTRLRDARAEQGWTKAKLVHLIERCARAKSVTINKTTQSLMREVSYWESGARNPQEPTLGLLCEIYSKTAYELGLSPTPDQARSDVGLVYSPSLTTTVDNLDKLATFDETRHASVTSQFYSTDALNTAYIDWMIRESEFDTHNGGITIGDVEKIESAAKLFDTLDRRMKGPVARINAIKFVRTDLVPMLARTHDNKLSKALFTAAAMLCEVIGWMAYADEQHGLAHRYFIQALRLSKNADQPAYGAYVLNTMSHQALFLNRPDNALRFALAAQAHPSVNSVPIVATESALLAAQAHARMNDTRPAEEKMAESEHIFSHVTSSNTPSWASHWNDTVFATFIGSCWIDLDKPQQAYGPLKMAWNAEREQPRRRTFSTSQLAKVALLAGDVEQAATLGLNAIESSSPQTSQRTWRVIRELQEQLRRYSTVPKVVQFNERAHTLLAG